MANNSAGIISGPSKFDLMLALFNNSVSSPKLVSFELDTHVTILVSINMVAREDGSGESWLFEGFTQPSSNSVWLKVKGYYTTKRRTGHVTSIPN